MARFNFIELLTSNVGVAKSFYSSVFGWELSDFGPTYSCTLTGDVDLGLQGDATEATRAPLAVIAVDDLDQVLGCRAGRRHDYKTDFRVSGRPAFSLPRSKWE